MSTKNYAALTTNQKIVLDMVLAYITAHGFPPTLREIMQKTGIKSLRGVAIQLEALEVAGFIKRYDVARGISVIKDHTEDAEDTVEIPLMLASIHAGEPSDADSYSDINIQVKLSQTKGIRNAFAVKVQGDSMINAGINDGDTVIIAPQKTAYDGEIVAAFAKGGVAIKKFRIIEGKPVLFPANPVYPAITEDFEIQGKLLSVIKAHR